jgi:trimethylamine:corrinoid methyltransferase-like protein
VMHATKPWYVLDSSTGTLGSRQRNGLAHFGDPLLKVMYLGDRFDHMFTVYHCLVHSSKCPSSTVSNPARVSALASTIILGDHDDHARGGPCSFQCWYCN